MNRGGFPVDRARSVFVGNISYEVTEEQLRDTFGKVGSVVHLRLVHDRDTGKPKGYGFCEFADIKSAEAAIRNLNGFELNGRALRVDSAAGDVGRPADESHAAAVTAPPEESPYGKECEPGRSTEAISRSVASLPPEKMFQLMRQMKDVVVSNPAEAKQMLLDNPQLAYALLQAQVVMRIVDPQVAMSMLHRESPAGQTTPFHQAPPPATVPPSHGAYGQPPMRGPPTFSTPSMPPPSSMSASHPFSGPPPGYSSGGPPPNFAQPPPGYPPAGRAPPAEEYSDVDRNNAELLMQVLNLTEAEMAALPPEDRQKVLALRNQLRNA